MKTNIVSVVIFVLAISFAFRSEAVSEVKSFPSPDGKKIAVLHCNEWAARCYINLSIEGGPEKKAVDFNKEKGYQYKPHEIGKHIYDGGGIKWSFENRFFVFEIIISKYDDDWHEVGVMVYDTQSEKVNKIVASYKGYGIRSFSFLPGSSILRCVIVLRQVDGLGAKKCDNIPSSYGDSWGLHKMLKIEKDFANPKKKEKRTYYDKCTQLSG